MSAIGSEIKMNVHVNPIGGIHLSDCDFTCHFFCYPNKVLNVKKEEMIKVDDDNYTALVYTKNLGTGMLYMTIKVEIPDADFEDGLRTEIETVCTGEVIAPQGVCR